MPRRAGADLRATRSMGEYVDSSDNDSGEEMHVRFAQQNSDYNILGGQPLHTQNSDIDILGPGVAARPAGRSAAVSPPPRTGLVFGDSDSDSGRPATTAADDEPIPLQARQLSGLSAFFAPEDAKPLLGRDADADEHDHGAAAPLLRHAAPEPDTTHGPDAVARANEAYRQLLPLLEQQRAERRRRIWTNTLLAMCPLLLILIIGLVAGSFKPVERQRVGFKQLFGAINTDTLYKNGNHLVGPAATFVTVPGTLHRVCFDGDDALEVAASSAQTIRIEVCFHYRPDARFGRVYEKYGERYTVAVPAIVRGALKNEAPKYTFTDYVHKRVNVSQGLRTAALTALAASQLHMDVPAEGFLLGGVELPRSVLAQNVLIFELSERMVKQNYDKTSALVRIMTQQNVSRINADAVIVKRAADHVRARMNSAATHRARAIVDGARGVLLNQMADRLAVQTPRAREIFSMLGLLLARVDTGDARVVLLDSVAGGVTPFVR